MKILLLKNSFFFTFLILIHISVIAEGQNKFKVGVIAPLSGLLAEYGLASQNGIELARSQHPDKFNNLVFVYEDSQWEAKKAVLAFNKLRDRDNASVIFNWGNPTTEALAPIAESKEFPLIGLSLDPTVANHKKYVIRSTNSATDFAGVLAKYLKSKNFKNIGLVISDNTYVEGLYEGLKKSLGNDANLEVLDRYNNSDQDFRSTVSKLRTRKYDTLGVFLITGQISTFYRQLAEQSVSIPTFGTDFFESTTEITLANGKMDGAVYPHLKVTDQFRLDYTERFKNDYQLAYAGNAYDMAMILGELFNNNSSTSSSNEIIKSLKTVKNQEGIGGHFSFVETAEDGPHYHFPVQLKRIEGQTIKNLALE